MSVRVERPGLLTTVQDLGRRAQEYGVVRGGAMDRRAARIGNMLVGNAEGEAVLEATLTGPTVSFGDAVLVAITGADFDARLDGDLVPGWRPFVAGAGSVLRLGGARVGCRAYIAIGGGIDVPVVLGSRGTDLGGGFGGTDGRALVAGDVVAVGAAGPDTQRLRGGLQTGACAAWCAGRSLSDYVAAAPRVRIVEGPEHDAFSDAARLALVSAPFEVTPQSNRMGYRLRGAALELEAPLEMISSPVSTGTIQVPPSGQPIVLMADAQTIGGYPRIAHVITADLPVLAQLAPGASVRFERVTLEDAHRIQLARERDIALLATAIGLQ